MTEVIRIDGKLSVMIPRKHARWTMLDRSTDTIGLALKARYLEWCKENDVEVHVDFPQVATKHTDRIQVDFENEYHLALFILRWFK